MVNFIQATNEKLIEQARTLFLEYAASLNFDLCFQNFEQELQGLPGEYAPPAGRLILAFFNDELAGCIALKRLAPEICEMKRLYVRSKFRGKGIGRRLVEEIVSEGKKIGYSRIRLDTIDTMIEAISLYCALGFQEILPYYDNPVEGARFFELNLK